MLEENADSIKPLFTTTFRRETREYAPRPGVRILLMIDSGSVHLGSADANSVSAEEPISELELELVEGSPDDLLDYALQLGRDLPLMPEDVSKAQRGYQLLASKPVRATRSGNSRLVWTMSLHEAFLALAFDCLQAWQANALGALTHADPEFIHQLRVALRRLRTLLRIFAEQLPTGFAEQWEHQLSDLADRVGEARDLDVMHDSLLAAPLRGPRAPDPAAILERLHEASDQARQRAREVLHSADARVLLLQFARALHNLAETDAAQTDAPSLQQFVRHCMSHLRKRVHARLRRARQTCEAPHLHQLRIALKQLRYAQEFFSPLMNRKARKRYARKLTEALRRLGALNDIEVGSCKLQSWATASTKLDKPTSWVLAWHAALNEQRAGEALKETAQLLAFSAPWKKFRNAHAAD
jgi:adenylate cyclase